MAAQSLEPRMVALLDDACWLIYRLFGVSPRLRIPGLDQRDRPWEVQIPWVCHFIHTGEAWNPSNPDANFKSGCRMADINESLPSGKSHTPCLSGLTHVTIPVRAGKSAAGTLTLGPFLSHPPSESGFRKLCRDLQTSPWAHLRWAYQQSPHLPPKREREMTAFAGNLFERIFSSTNSSTPPRRNAAGIYEFAYPPLRLAEDFPLHIYGVFVNFGEMKADTELGAPAQICRLEYMENGRGSIQLDGRTFEQSRGQFLLILPGDRAIMQPVIGPDKCERISISFHGTASILSDISGKLLNADPFQLTLLSRITDLSAVATDAAHRDSEVKALLVLLLFSLRRLNGIGVETPPAALPHLSIREGATVRDIKRLLEESGARMSLSTIARQLHITVSTLRRQFKQQAGITPVAYRRQHLIIKAKLLLRSGNQSVSEVSHRLGFCSIHYFSGVFKKISGMSPSAYTRSMMATDRQTEEAEIRLREHMEKPAVVARKLGYDSPNAFAQAFRQRKGISPRKFGRGNNKPEKG